MEYYSALKKTEMSFAGKWMEPELILLSEISQTEKDKHHMLSLYAETRPEKKKKNDKCKTKGCLGMETSVGGGMQMERVKKGECVRNTSYSCMKTE
jgi:hypothetical protein